MSLPWSAQQIEWLQAMGLEVLQRPVNAGASVSPSTVSAPGSVPAAFARAARGADIASLLASTGTPRDVTTRRAFWRALRPLRKAARNA
ncbi:hypothetical protein [Lysobacter claricitrinus]|uniref:hypothetical protein n=1 Tax=Lysobacter claricitrinus TaxID=3367728 RepID=UPI0037DA85DB